MRVYFQVHGSIGEDVSLRELIVEEESELEGTCLANSHLRIGSNGIDT